MSRARSRRRKYGQQEAAPAITKGLGSVGTAIRTAFGGAPGAWASDHREEANQFVGWNYVAIKAIMTQFGGAERQVFQERPEVVTKVLRKSHDREVPDNFLELTASQSRLVRILKRPNPAESGATFQQKIAMQLELTGSAYIYKMRNAQGLTVEMYVIPTGMLTPQQPTAQFPKGYYRVEDFARPGSDGWADMGNFYSLSGQFVDPLDLIVIRDPHPWEPGDGQSSVSAGALWSDTSKQVDQARWSHMKNGINPSVAISPDKESNPTPEEIDRASTVITTKYAGSQNAGKPMFVPPGATVTPLSQTAEEMGYVQGADQLRNSILALHCVPGSAAGITDGGSYAAFYANLLQFITLKVQPMLDLVAEELTHQLAYEYGENLVIWLTAKGVNDPEVLERQLNTDIAAKSILINEVRQLRGLEPRPDGDKYVGEVPPAPQPGMPGQFPGAPQLSEEPDEESTGIAGTPKLTSLTKGEGDGGCGTGAGGFKPGNTCAGEGGGGDDGGGESDPEKTEKPKHTEESVSAQADKREAEAKERAAKRSQEDKDLKDKKEELTTQRHDEDSQATKARNTELWEKVGSKKEELEGKLAAYEAGEESLSDDEVEGIQSDIEALDDVRTEVNDKHDAIAESKVAKRERENAKLEREEAKIERERTREDRQLDREIAQEVKPLKQQHKRTQEKIDRWKEEAKKDLEGGKISKDKFERKMEFLQGKQDDNDRLNEAIGRLEDSGSLPQSDRDDWRPGMRMDESAPSAGRLVKAPKNSLRLSGCEALRKVWSSYP